MGWKVEDRMKGTGRKPKMERRTTGGGWVRVEGRKQGIKERGEKGRIEERERQRWGRRK